MLVELAQVGELDEVSASDAASARLSWVIWGLLALAGIIAVVTLVFWWLTRPDRDGATRGVRWVGRGGGTVAGRAPDDGRDGAGGDDRSG